MGGGAKGVQRAGSAAGPRLAVVLAHRHDQGVVLVEQVPLPAQGTLKGVLDGVVAELVLDKSEAFEDAPGVGVHHERWPVQGVQ